MNQLLRGTFFTSRRNIRGIIFFGIAVVLVYLYVGGDSGLYQIWKQTKTKVSLERDIEEQKKIKEKNTEEKVKLEQKDVDYIEKRAREDLGMVKKGEQVYLIIQDKEKKKE